MAKRPPSTRPRSQAADATATPEATPRPRTRRPRAGAADNPADAAIASSEPTSETGEIGAADMTPTEEEIRERAYHRYLQRGGGHGMDFDDWLEAERELKTHRRG